MLIVDYFVIHFVLGVWAIKQCHGHNNSLVDVYHDADTLVHY